MIKGLAHACFTVSNLEASTVFYRDKLGLKAAFEFRRDDGTLFGMYFHAGQRTFIEIFAGQLKEKAANQSYRHICFEVDDVPATVAELRGRGLEVTEPKMGTDNSWQAWLNDPDGNPIELMAYTPTSKQNPWLK